MVLQQELPLLGCVLPLVTGVQSAMILLDLAAFCCETPLSLLEDTWVSQHYIALRLIRCVETTLLFCVFSRLSETWLASLHFPGPPSQAQGAKLFGKE